MAPPIDPRAATAQQQATFDPAKYFGEGLSDEHAKLVRLYQQGEIEIRGLGQFFERYHKLIQENEEFLQKYRESRLSFQGLLNNVSGYDGLERATLTPQGTPNLIARAVPGLANYVANRRTNRQQANVNSVPEQVKEMYMILDQNRQRAEQLVEFVKGMRDEVRQNEDYFYTLSKTKSKELGDLTQEESVKITTYQALHAKVAEELQKCRDLGIEVSETGRVADDSSSLEKIAREGDRVLELTPEQLDNRQQRIAQVQSYKDACRQYETAKEGLEDIARKKVGISIMITSSDSNLKLHENVIRQQVSNLLNTYSVLEAIYTEEITITKRTMVLLSKVIASQALGARLTQTLSDFYQVRDSILAVANNYISSMDEMLQGLALNGKFDQAKVEGYGTQQIQIAASWDAFRDEMAKQVEEINRMAAQIPDNKGIDVPKL